MSSSFPAAGLVPDLAAQQGVAGRSKLAKAALVEALTPAAAPKRGRRKTSLGPAHATRTSRPARRPRLPRFVPAW
jgi:hypothetical protein